MTFIFEHQTYFKDHTISIALNTPQWFDMPKVKQRKMYRLIWKWASDPENRFRDECIDNFQRLRHELVIEIGGATERKRLKKLVEIDAMIDAIT